MPAKKKRKVVHQKGAHRPETSASRKIRAWLDADNSKGSRREKLRTWLKERNQPGITFWLYTAQTSAHKEALTDEDLGIR
jgi:hypothetical protein